MQIPQSKSNKFALTFLVISAIFWLGAINIRALIQNELLNFDQFNFRTNIPPDRENTLFQLVSNSSIVAMGSYLVVLFSAIWFLLTTSLKFKENGWLVMATILFFLFLPVEIYTYYIDMRFILLYYSHPPNHDELLRLFGMRLGALSGVPVIALLCYYTIIPIAIFRPLTRIHADEEKKAG
jgi:hypothetical protein